MLIVPEHSDATTRQNSCRAFDDALLRHNKLLNPLPSVFPGFSMLIKAIHSAPPGFEKQRWAEILPVANPLLCARRATPKSRRGPRDRLGVRVWNVIIIGLPQQEFVLCNLLRLSCARAIRDCGKCRGVAQPGRAPGSGPGGRRFKSSLPDHSSVFALFAIRSNGIL